MTTPQPKQQLEDLPGWADLPDWMKHIASRIATDGPIQIHLARRTGRRTLTALIADLRARIDTGEITAAAIFQTPAEPPSEPTEPPSKWPDSEWGSHGWEGGPATKHIIPDPHTHRQGLTRLPHL